MYATEYEKAKREKQAEKKKIADPQRRREGGLRDDNFMAECSVLGHVCAPLPTVAAVVRFDVAPPERCSVARRPPCVSLSCRSHRRYRRAYRRRRRRRGFLVLRTPHMMDV